MMISNAMTLFIWSSPIAGYKHTAMLLVISVCLFLFIAYKNDNVFSLSISDVCGPTICVRGAWRWGRCGLYLGAEKNLKPRVRGMLVNRADSHTSTARCVSCGMMRIAEPFYFSRLPSLNRFIISFILFIRVCSRLALSIHLMKFFL